MTERWDREESFGRWGDNNLTMASATSSVSGSPSTRLVQVSSAIPHLLDLPATGRQFSILLKILLKREAIAFNEPCLRAEHGFVSSDQNAERTK
jgi:hypothetical protein